MTDGNSKERVRLHRERKKVAEQDRGQPWEGLVGEEREQTIRDHFGYAKSETRSQAERQAVADRITGSERAKETLAQAQEVWDRQGSEADERRRVKHEDLRDKLLAAGVKNVPAEFAQDSEARAKRAADYAEWRERYLAENPQVWP